MDVLTNEDTVNDPAEARKQRRKEIVKDAILIIALIAGVIIGIGLGLGLRDVWGPEDKRKIFYLQFPGQLLLNMLKVNTLYVGLPVGLCSGSAD